MEPTTKLLNLKTSSKPDLLVELKAISQYYFDQKDFISAGHVNRTIDIIENDPTIVSPDTLKTMP